MPMTLPSFAQPLTRSGLLLLAVLFTPAPSRSGVLVLALLFTPATAPADERTGEQIYKELFARCHGASGEGTKKHPHALAGDKSAAQLTKIVRESMPEDNPGSLKEQDAEK